MLLPPPSALQADGYLSTRCGVLPALLPPELAHIRANTLRVEGGLGCVTHYALAYIATLVGTQIAVECLGNVSCTTKEMFACPHCLNCSDSPLVQSIVF